MIKNKRITIRLSDDEYKIIVKTSKRLDITTSAALRWIVRAYPMLLDKASKYEKEMEDDINGN